MSMETLAEQPLQEELNMPLVMAVPETALDEESRLRAAKFIGQVAINEGSPATTEALGVKPIESLHQAIHEADGDNPEARKMVEMNARTDVIERTMKSGHVMKVDLMVDEAGNIQQHGQSMESVQANSLKFAANSWQMKGRVEAETTNLFRINQWHEKGVLDEYCFVVFSRAADNMTKEEMDEAGFFTETMTCSIQVTTAENGRLTTESAFVSGVKKPGGLRHDEETMRGVATELGAEITDENATVRIGTPILIHKSKLKDGAINLVELWDKNVPRDYDEEIFFGAAKPKQDYSEYLEICREREKRFEPKVQNITNRLIAERQSIRNRADAVKRLHEISGEEMIDQAFGDPDIDPRVFGPIAAEAIEQGRMAIEQGRYDDAINYRNVARANDQSGSCPGAGLGPKELNGDNDNDKSASGTCEFVSKECPECGAKNVKTKVTRNKITGSCGCSKSK